MANKSYSDKLRDPRWQKKRLEIMGRDQFTCQNCGAKDKTLNVHHCAYIKGLDPWEYGFSLITLCELCHVERQDAQDQLLVCTCRLNNKQLFSLASFIGSFFNLQEHVNKGELQ